MNKVKLCDSAVLECAICRKLLLGEMAIKCAACSRWQCKGAHIDAAHMCTPFKMSSVEGGMTWMVPQETEWVAMETTRYGLEVQRSPFPGCPDSEYKFDGHKVAHQLAQPLNEEHVRYVAKQLNCTPDDISSLIYTKDGTLIGALKFVDLEH